MKRPAYKEGDVFSLPLRNGKIAIGVLARSSRARKVLLGYFFSYQFEKVPVRDELPELMPCNAISVLRFGALSLRNGEWKIISQIEDWPRKRHLWSIPRFLRRFPIGNRAWLVSYADNDVSVEMANEPCESDIQGIRPDEMCGAGYVEIMLTKLIEEPPTTTATQ